MVQPGYNPTVQSTGQGGYNPTVQPINQGGYNQMPTGYGPQGGQIPDQIPLYQLKVDNVEIHDQGQGQGQGPQTNDFRVNYPSLDDHMRNQR